MSDLRKALIRLAHEKPSLRPHLVPLLSEKPARRLSGRGKEAMSWSRRLGPMPRSSYLPTNNPTLQQLKGTPPGLEIFSYETAKSNGTATYTGIAFAGKANKPLWYYNYRDQAHLDKQVATTIDSYKASQAAKQKRRQERREYRHPYVVGDILSGSWGYDQTNVEFYEVVGIPSPKSIAVREIGMKTVRSDRGSDYVVPAPGKYTGPVLKKIPSTGGYIRVSDSISVSKWDGKPEYQTAFGWGH